MYKQISAEQVPVQMPQYEALRLVWYVSDEDYHISDEPKAVKPAVNRRQSKWWRK